MAAEWTKSTRTDASIGRLVDVSLLHKAANGDWRPSTGESYPNPSPRELAVFEDFYWRGFGVPEHPFLRKLIDHYKINLCNPHPNSILSISIFINLCEGYLGIFPHFNLFRHFFCQNKKGGWRLKNCRRGVSKPPGWDEAPPSACTTEYLNEGLVQEVVLRDVGAGATDSLRRGPSFRGAGELVGKAYRLRDGIGQ